MKGPIMFFFATLGMMMMVNGMKESGSFLGVVFVTATNFVASVRQ
jgi:hypothetical protein